MSPAFIIEEIPYDEKRTEDRTIHEVSLERGDHQWITSLNAFSSGERKAASKEDRRTGKDRCNWGPKSLFYCKGRVPQWEEETRETLQLLRKSLPNWPDKTAFPRVKHASLAAFYKHIGFDHKTRTYTDKKGQRINFSASEPKKVQKSRPCRAAPQQIS